MMHVWGGKWVGNGGRMKAGMGSREAAKIAKKGKGKGKGQSGGVGGRILGKCGWGYCK